MSGPSRTTRWAVGLALLALGVTLFLLSCEPKELSIPVGYQGEARTNHFLAAQRMLARMGMQVRGIDGIDELAGDLPVDGTLILPTPRATLTRERSLGLREWVERGGQLVVVSWTLWDEEERLEDFLLDDLGVQQFMHRATPDEEQEEDLEDPETADKTSPSADDAVPVLAQVAFAGRELPLEARFDPLFFLERPDGEIHWSISDENGTHLMQIRLGWGLLTVMTDHNILHNDTITVRDHAELVWRLVHSGDRSGPVWIVHNEDYPGAWALVWKHAWMILCSLGVLVGAWIWAASRRFGPEQPDDALERRRLMEHVEAAGRLQWRQGTAQGLLHGVRESLLERVGQRHPGWVQMAPAELNRRLAELAGLPPERVACALAFRIDSERDTFAKNIATLERIRKAL